MRVVAFGEQMTCTDIEEASARDGEDGAERYVFNRRKNAHKDAENRSERVGDEPGHRFPAFRTVFKDDAYGIHAVRKIMGKDGGGDHPADCRRSLEGNADHEAVEKAVETETRRTEGALVFVVAVVAVVRVEKAVEEHVGDESHADKEGDEGNIMHSRSKLKRFRQEVEKGRGNHGAGRKTGDEMEFIAESEGKKTTEKCREKGSQADKECLHSRIHKLTRFPLLRISALRSGAKSHILNPVKRLSAFRKNYLRAIRVGWFLAVRQIKRSGKGTTGLIVFIMVLAFLNLVVVSGLLIGLITGSYSQYREAYSGDVLVTTAPGRSYIEHSRELISFFKTHPSVTAISPRHTATGQILGSLTSLPKQGERANVMGARLVGFDADLEEEATHFSRFITYGENLEKGEEGYILVGANLLKKYSSFADVNIPGLDLLQDVDVGSRVRVTISNGGESASKEFIIKGVIKSKVDEISTRVFMNDNELKRMLSVNKEEFQEITVRTDRSDDVALVAEAREFMNGYDARIQTSDESIPSFLRDIESTFGILGNALSSIAVVVASITVFIVIFINAVTKKKFIGIMKGIGIAPRAIQFSYVFQAFFYAAVGSAIGLFLTFGVLKPYFDVHPIDFPFSDGILVATPEGAAIRVAILLIVTLAAGYLPAKLIVRKNTLDSILGR